ncbi:phage integrase [Arsenophonus nasoniae]|uniref:Tyrosine-type recombinase/integrase n=1 Tax=Arsenophonus nasoniae TaxID=638 RepID=A0AA95K0C1_9GAMM|nr:tyrosine-type recombinase/integrase [Arsenophonus nasoniae]WGL94636.1 tyrosine-type recombinase/integrase [Arsenophonus nasoniae]
MSIKKLEDGRYEVDIRPNGRNGKRIRRKFQKKQEAVVFERYVMANHNKKEWSQKFKDTRPLQDIVEQWWNLYGKHTDYGKLSYQRAMRVCKAMGSLAGFQVTKSSIALYQESRLAAGIKPSTINRDLFAFRGIYTQLIKTGLYPADNPFSNMIPIKEKATEMSYLTHDEIRDLLANLQGDYYKIAIFCMSTGARWGEAKRLKREHIIENKVRFTFTKTGKPRIVPISHELSHFICEGKKDLLFSSVLYSLFRETLKKVKPTLPNGQATHVLRHTFATHFMMNGGSIITLQRILGHSSLNQTMTYAHFAPDFLQDAIQNNPLKGGINL